ncbi:GNAT family N-acetyltransferase [Bacillus sp. FJAT-29814]|uniref:GNAT family N-acetyltransferase n=1 Tax=Bacillus sp. FJAT-29814 TaxID=1729688 RepID=UPI0008344618|nr:GNAT family N-acetyltransferase [Bacillus sp. FJAT-29814]
MFTRLVPNDPAVAEGSHFMKDEVQYNHIHRIIEDAASLSFKTKEGKMIFAQMPGRNGFLWISSEVTPTERNTIFQELAHTLKELPGIVADPQTAKEFLEVYSKTNAARSEIIMTTEAYLCPKILPPKNLIGEIHKTTDQHSDIVTEYLVGFHKDAFGTLVEPVTQATRAKNMIESGDLYFWMVNDWPVSMAYIAHRSPRHARITAVYTPNEYRKNGYASMLVAGLCAIIQSENLVPMLFADTKNPDSNRIYQNIGFIKSGQIEEIKFL